MDKAAARLAAAVQAGETIAVFGDYDVDGATSSALLQRYLTAVGARCRVHIPDRIAEGYGPNAPALLRLQAEGAGVCVTVDCGTTAHAPLAAAARGRAGGDRLRPSRGRAGAAAGSGGGQPQPPGRRQRGSASSPPWGSASCCWWR